MTLDPKNVAPVAPLIDPADRAVVPNDGVADQVVNGGLIRTGGFVVTNLIALVSAVILARYLNKADFGRYGTVMAVITIIYGITDGGLNIVGTRELSLKEPGAPRRALTGVILGIRIVLTTVGVGLAVIVGLALGFTKGMLIGTAIAGAGSIAVASFSTLTLPALVELKNLRLLSVEVTRQVIQLVGTVLCVVAGFGLVSFYGVQAVIGPLIVILLPVLIGRGVLVRPRYDRAEWVHMVRVALPIAVAAVLSVLYLKVIVLIGSQALSHANQGLLVMCTRAVEILSGLPLLVVGVALPVVARAARDDAARLRYVGQRLLESAVILGILLSLPLSFGASTALRILGGNAYVAAAPALQIQAWMLLSVFVVQGCVVLLISMHRERAIVISNVIGLVAVIVLGVILLPARGVVGGGIAVVAADAILMVAMLGFVLTSDLRGQLGLGALPRIVAAALLAVGAGFAMPGGDFLSAVAATIVFAILLVVLRGAPSEVLAMLPVPRRGGAD